MTKINKGSAYRTVGEHQQTELYEDSDEEETATHPSADDVFKESTFNMFSQGEPDRSTGTGRKSAGKGKNRSRAGSARDGEAVSVSEMNAHNSSAAYRRLMQNIDASYAQANATPVGRIKDSGASQEQSGGRRGRQRVMSANLSKIRQKIELKKKQKTPNSGEDF